MNAMTDAFARDRVQEAERDPVVSIEGVSIAFGSGAGRVEALRGIDLAVARDSFVSIVGRSGCGKSTLLRIIAGLLAADTGAIRVMGLPVAEYGRGRRFGFVFQDASLFPWKTAAQNIALPMQILRIGDKVQQRDRVEALLQLVQLDGFGGHYPAQLSGGMRQRVAIARALAYEPEILLMDEPFGALDEFTRREMHDQLVGIWNRRPLTVVFVTHSLSEALYLSDRIVVMAPRPGRVRAVVDVVHPRPADRAVLRSASYLAQLAELEQLLDEA
jgi:NitT/TauT family transport system ATP-binding protein